MKFNSIANNLILLILFCVLTFNIYGQKKNEFRVQTGYAQASQSLSRLGMFQTSYWSQNIHNAFGNIEYYRNFNENSAFGLGFQIVEKGFRADYTLKLPSYNLHQRYFFKFDYLEIPIMYRYTYKGFFLNIGAICSYLIKSAQGSSYKRFYADGKTEYSAGTSYNPKVFNKFDVGLIARLGMNIDDKLSFNFSFTRGFLRPYIFNSGELNYNEVFLVGLSYKIN
jgi:hypothetical protein